MTHLPTPAERLRSEIWIRLECQKIDPSSYEFDLFFVSEHTGQPGRNRSDLIFLDHITSYERGQGLGGTIMRTCLRLADELDVSIALSVWTQKQTLPGTLRRDQLIDWYNHLGFTWIDDETMLRAPGKAIGAKRHREMPEMAAIRQAA